MNLEGNLYFSFNKLVVDVYELILEHGTLGALAYANKIEKQNYTLASEIDSVVTKLVNRQYRTAQNLERLYGQPNTAYNPTSNIITPTSPQNTTTNPQQYVATQRLQQLQDPRERQQTSVPTYLNENVRRWGTVPFYWKQIVNQYSIKNINKLINIAETSTNGIAREQALQNLQKIVVNCPQNLPSTDLSGNKFIVSGRKDILNLIEQSNIPQKNELIIDIFHDLKQTHLGKDLHMGWFESKIPGWNRGKQYLYKLHQQSKLDKFPKDFFEHSSSGLNNIIKNDPEIYKELLKEKPSAIPEILGEKITQLTNDLGALSHSPAQNASRIQEINDKISRLQGAKVQFGNYLGSNEALSAAKKTSGELINGKEKIAQKWLDLLIQKFPKLEPFVGVLGKALGVLMFAWQFWSLWQEFQEYGADGRFYCDLISALLGLGVFTPAAPIVAVLSLVLSLGCGFWVQHAKVEKGVMPTEAYMKAHQNEVNDKNVDQDDLKLLIDLVQTSEQGGVSALDEVDRAAQAGKFKNLRDIYTLWWKYNNVDSSCIPDLKKKYSNLDPAASTQKANALDGTKAAFTFNMKKYSL